MDKKKLKKILFTRIALTPAVFGLALFLPAGTLRYWEAWVYIGILMILMAGVMVYFLKHDPEVLERRMKAKEKEQAQKAVVASVVIMFIAGFVLIGLDRRFGLSTVPIALVLAADGLVILGYAVFIAVLRANRFLSRTVEVETEQKIVTTGPYAVVRHPMYVGVLLMYLFTPLALGSFWALIPFAVTMVILPVRIVNEEKVLLRDLAGYGDYMKKTRFRLIPGIW
ncbi:MAG: isoprenylcysteine carboxylmethyltransferase family protein [Candidatus Aminicenantes bacterium]|nr:isoprenylcysteine carboxylmethyltransferase family protein [Candidatus Aminicenantes bacterium]